MSGNMSDQNHFTCHTCQALGEAYYEGVHESGLRIMVYPKMQSACYAALGVKYGSVHRGGPGELLGVAHFLEHKMFGMPDGGEADACFAALGADANACTTYDRTTYQFSCTDRFEEALALLLHLTDDLYVTDQSVERERAIISEEIRMDADDPAERCFAAMLRALYRYHPIREEICGTEASVNRITPDALRRVFARRYKPEDMILSVSGPVTPDEVWAVADRARRGIRPSGAVGQSNRRRIPGAGEPPTVFRDRVTLRMPVAKPLFCIGIKDPAVPAEPRDVCRREQGMLLLHEMLFSESCAFHNHLLETGLVSPGMAYGFTVGQGYGFYQLEGEADDSEAVFAAFLEYMDHLHKEGLSREDFTRIRRIRYADFVTGFDSAEDVAEALLSCAQADMGLFDLLDISQSITFEQVGRLFEETFCPGQYAMSVVRPEPASES